MKLIFLIALFWYAIPTHGMEQALVPVQFERLAGIEKIDDLIIPYNPETFNINIPLIKE